MIRGIVFIVQVKIDTVVPVFKVLGFSALPGFRALKAVDGPSALNPGTTVRRIFQYPFFKTGSSI